MTQVFEGQLQAREFRFGIIVSRYNSMITARLLDGALDALKRTGAEEKAVDIYRVPGSFEIPQAAKEVAAAVSMETDDRQTRFLSPLMAQALNDQVAYEMYSAYTYYMVSAWSQSKGLTGFANWFKGQGDDEIVHAMKIYQYLVDTGTEVTLPAIPSPGAELSGIVTMEDATRAVLDHEMSVTARWQRIGEMAKAEPNLATQELAQWFMTEQVEEEDGAVTLHQKVQLADSGAGLLIIDHELAELGG